MSKKPDLRALAGCILEGNGDFEEVHILGGLIGKASLNANIVDVMGGINLDGSLWANSVECRGGVTVGADLITEGDIKIAGSLKCGGKLRGYDINIYGGADVQESVIATNLTVKGGIKANREIRVEGELEVIGGLKTLAKIIAHELKAVGGFKAGLAVEVTETIEVTGQIEVDESVECQEFDMKITDPSYIEGTLQADKVNIELDENAKREAFLKVKEIISPNKVTIDYVIAEKVIAPKIKAGENCRINEAIEKKMDI